MFPIVVLRLPGPCQQVASLSHIASWESNECNLRLVRSSWFISKTKGNTIGLGWPHLQRFTRRPAWHPKPLEPLTVSYSLHRKATPLPEAFPIASAGNLLSPDEFRIAIVLRTGANIFESTECHCRKFVDRLGLHGLSCIKNAGCFPRHSAINFIFKQLLTRIGLSSFLEPVGLTRDIRRQSDGLALNP